MKRTAVQYLEQFLVERGYVKAFEAIFGTLESYKVLSLEALNPFKLSSDWNTVESDWLIRKALVSLECWEKDEDWEQARDSLCKEMSEFLDSYTKQYGDDAVKALYQGMHSIQYALFGMQIRSLSLSDYKTACEYALVRHNGNLQNARSDIFYGIMNVTDFDKTLTKLQKNELRKLKYKWSNHIAKTMDTNEKVLTVQDVIDRLESQQTGNDLAEAVMCEGQMQCLCKLSVYSLNVIVQTTNYSHGYQVLTKNDIYKLLKSLVALDRSIVKSRFIHYYVDGQGNSFDVTQSLVQTVRYDANISISAEKIAVKETVQKETTSDNNNRLRL